MFVVRNAAIRINHLRIATFQLHVVASPRTFDFVRYGPRWLATSTVSNDLLATLNYTDRSIAAGEWIHLHDCLMEKEEFQEDDILQAEECLRYWTVQARKTGQSNEAVAKAFDLFNHVHTAVREQDEAENQGDAWRRRGNKTGSPFLWLEGNYPRSTHVYNAILDAWRIAGATFPRPMDLFEDCKRNTDGIVLNARSYAIIIKAVTETCRVALAPLFCETIMRWMMEAEEPIYVPPQKSIRPDCVVLSSVLHAWAKSARTDAAERAEILFKHYTDKSSDYPNGSLNTYTYNTLLSAILTRTRRTLSLPERRLRLERAELIFCGMTEKKYAGVMPTAFSYHLLISAWADYYTAGRSGGADHVHMRPALDRSSTLLARLVHLYTEANAKPALTPQPDMFGKILWAIAASAKGSEHDLLLRAEKLYRHMLRLYAETGTAAAFAPDIHTLRAMVIAYCKMGRIQDAEYHIQKLENNPNMSAGGSHYRDVLFGWIGLAQKYHEDGKRKDCLEAVENGEKFLSRMVDQSVKTGRKDILPTRDCITRLLELWVFCREPDRAEALLRGMKELYRMTEYITLKPREPAYHKVIEAYGSVGGSDADGQRAEKIEALLREMLELYYAGDIEMKPTKQVYNDVVSAWSRTARHDRLERCMAILNDIRTAFHSGKQIAPPDLPLYGAVLKACSKAGTIEVAIQVLSYMLDDLNKGNKLASPTVGIFNMIILACLRSSDLAKGEKALEVYNMMNELNKTYSLHLIPDQRTYSLVAETLAKSPNKELVEMSNQFVQKMHLARQQNRPA